MTKQINKLWQSLLLATIAVVLIFGANFPAAAQNANYKVGDKIEVEWKRSWYKAEILEVKDGQFKIHYDGFADSWDEWVKPERMRFPGKTQNAEPKTDNDAETNRADAKYNPGDRVECQPTPKIGAYRKGTVVTMMDDGRYRVRFDDEPLYPEGIICESEYMRPSGEAAPPPTECPFNKNYAKVSNKAAPSAELFKSVIFEWQNSTSNFHDFGLTFLDFKMGQAFKNRVYPGVNVRKDVDTAPVGATIYPVKVKEMACKKDVTITQRWVTEIEYSCYKSEFGEWVCKNGAPIKVERTSIPNK
ncbi:MAG: agenet domain-containing protein [Acidobacteriota bacterium]